VTGASFQPCPQLRLQRLGIESMRASSADARALLACKPRCSRSNLTRSRRRDQCVLLRYCCSAVGSMALARIGFSAGEVICNQIHGRSPIESPCHARTLPAVEWNVAESIIWDRALSRLAAGWSSCLRATRGSHSGSKLHGLISLDDTIALLLRRDSMWRCDIASETKSWHAI